MEDYVQALADAWMAEVMAKREAVEQAEDDAREAARMSYTPKPWVGRQLWNR